MMRWLESTRTVSAPDGSAWTVRRVLLPHWRDQDGRRGKGGAGPGRDWSGWLDPMNLSLFDGDAPGLLAIVLVALILFVVLAPVLILIVDIIVVVMAAAAGIVGRLLFRRPWRIEASPAESRNAGYAWGVVGTRASAAATNEIAEQIAAGTPPGSIIVGVPLSG